MEENEKILKKGFFKKVWYSIFKLERYGEMSAEGVGRAIKYIFQLSIIFAAILGFATIYQINEKVGKGITFLNEQVGNFTYEEGILKVEKQEAIVAPSSTLGKIIIDTNVEDKEEINKYLNSIDTNMGILVLKDKVYIKGISDNGLSEYEYKPLLDGMGIQKINKEETINYLKGNEIWSFYLKVFLLLYAYWLVSTAISIILTAFILSIFGCIATFGTRIKIRYVAIFNLAAYALTLSTLLQALYVIINVMTGFTIKYFQVMYIGVAAIYLIASIFLIKSDFIKKQMQEIQNAERIKEEQEKTENQEENQEENKEKNKKEEDNDSNTKDEPNNENKEEKDKSPEGSEA